INAEYFNNAIPKPILAWTTRPNFRTLGTYNFHWDTICLSRILNDHRVPENAVRFILYHEMLHIKHGLYRVAGRAFAHTPQFRADEDKFPNRSEIEHTLRKLRELVKPKN
ncbi:MAG: M48 family peptidase, partial [Proteobacteria bacterium]|nr:M48 family peptidase [Pseudomonadota bacterium]